MPPSDTEPCFVTNIPSSPLGFLEDIRAELDLTRAYIQSAEMGTVTPLLKQELRYKIQARRLSEGRTELAALESKRKPVEDKLTVEDNRKRIIRQNQNKESSRRVRQRQIVREDKLWKKINTISAHNNKLRRIRSALLEEKESILKQLKDIGCDVLMAEDSPNTSMASHPKAASMVWPSKAESKVSLLGESSSKGMVSFLPESSNKSTVSPPKIRHIIMLSAEAQNKGVMLFLSGNPNKCFVLPPKSATLVSSPK